MNDDLRPFPPEKMIPMNLDIRELRRQKRALMRAIADAEQRDRILLLGVLSLLDHVHDSYDPPERDEHRMPDDDENDGA